MKLTQGAISNLINRYRAVLKKCHLLNTFGSLAVASMLVMGGAGGASATVINETTSGVHDYSGENLSYSSSRGDAITANGGDDRTQPQINIGNENTKNIVVDAVGGIFSMKSGNITLTSENITIKSSDTTGGFSALWAQNNSVNSDGIPENQRSSILINAKNTNIEAENSAIVAMSNGIIRINGNLYVEAKNAIVARGDAIIEINKSGEDTVQLNGDINFNYDGPTSGTGVNATVDIVLNGKNSYWNGNTFISWNGTPSDSSKLTVSEMKLSIKNGAIWTPTEIIGTESRQYTSLNKLLLDNGNINVNEGVTIAIDEVSGTGFLDNKGSVTLKGGALEGRTDNAGTIYVDPGASISNVTIEQGDAAPSSALIAVGAEQTVLNGGMMTGEGASASVASVAVDANKNVAINGIVFKGNAFNASQDSSVIGAVTANLGSGQNLTISSSTFENNTVTLDSTSAQAFGAAISVTGPTDSHLTISDSTFTGNKVEGAGGLGGAIYNAGTITFSGTNTFSNNTAGGTFNDIHNTGSITVASGTTTLKSGLTQAGSGSVTINSGGTLDMASGSTLAFDEQSKLTIDGGTFVSDVALLLKDDYSLQEDMTETQIIGTEGNLNLRLDKSTYTIDDYKTAKTALLNQNTENATLNFLNATLEVNKEEGQKLVAGATGENGELTLATVPVVADANESAADAETGNKTIESVPDRYVAVVSNHTTNKDLLEASSITVAEGFSAKGLQIKNVTAGADSVELKIGNNNSEDGPIVTLVGDGLGSTGVVDASEKAVTTTAVVTENATLNMGLEGNTNIRA